MHRYISLSLLGGMLATSWLSIAVLTPAVLRTVPYGIGYLIGSLLAHPTLAASWACYGPGRPAIRIPLSMVWMSLVISAIWINVSFMGGPTRGALELGSVLVGQWLVLLAPLATLRFAFGVRLENRSTTKATFTSQSLRFGVRHLLILMSVCGVLLAAGRIVVPQISLRGGGEMYIFVFLVSAAIILTLPLLFAALMTRRALLGVALAIVMITVATIWEFPIFEAIGGQGPGPVDFAAINVTGSLLVLIAALCLRWSGYTLTIRSSADSGQRA